MSVTLKALDKYSEAMKVKINEPDQDPEHITKYPNK